MPTARNGRPRKKRPGQNNVHLKRASVTNPREIAAGMPHRRGLGEQATSQLAETELGRMCLRGEISREQYLAGETFAGQWRGYLRTLNAPQSLTNGQGRVFPCDGCSAPESRKFCRCDLLRRICGETMLVLTAAGRPAQRAVQTVAIHDRQCPFDALDDLRVGLNILAQHFGLVRKNHAERQTTENRRSVAQRPSQAGG